MRSVLQDDATPLELCSIAIAHPAPQRWELDVLYQCGERHVDERFGLLAREIGSKPREDIEPVVVACRHAVPLSVAKRASGHRERHEHLRAIGHRVP